MSGPQGAGSPSFEELVQRAARMAATGRGLLGITGEPGAGKSTLARRLVGALAQRGLPIALVGMDAFHLADRALRELGLHEVKGAPETFDSDGYVTLLRRLREPGERTVWAPEFHREIEDAIAAAIPVGPQVRLVITEGNYLLLDGPWQPVRELLDQVWFVEVPEQLRQQRLAARHERYGRTEAWAWERTLGSDECNARTVLATRERADLVLTSTG
jgi:pantothenate kinase